MRYKYIPLLLILLTLLCGCSGTRKQAPEVQALSFDKEQTWQLVGQRGKEVSPRKTDIILIFHPESSTLRGRVACNRYFADYTMQLTGVDAEGTRYSLKISYVSGGDVQCPEGDMAEQERYLALLGKADACLLTPYTLILFQRGKEILKYELI